MVFDYLVRHDGIDYPAGADVPVEAKAPAKDNEAEKAEQPKKRTAKPKVSTKK